MTLVRIRIREFQGVGCMKGKGFFLPLSMLFLLCSLGTAMAKSELPEVVGTIDVGRGPNGIAINPEDDKLFVDLGKEVAVIDGSSGRIVATISRMNCNPSGDNIAVNAVTHLLYVIADEGTSIKVVSAKDYSILHTIPNPQGENGFFGGIAIDTSTNTIYATDWNGFVYAFDGFTNNLKAVIPLPSNADCYVNVNPANRMVYVTASKYSFGLVVIDGNAQRMEKKIPLHASYTAEIDRQHNFIYVTDGRNSLHKLDGSTCELMSTIKIGSGGQGIAYNPNTGHVFVANSDDNSVSVVDGEKDEVVVTLKVGNSPRKIAVNAKTNVVYVTNLGESSITVIKDR